MRSLRILPGITRADVPAVLGTVHIGNTGDVEVTVVEVPVGVAVDQVTAHHRLLVLMSVDPGRDVLDAAQLVARGGGTRVDDALTRGEQ